jgi:hypothetical protein
MKNTHLRVCYCDAHNYKNATEVVLGGAPRPDDIRTVIAATLDDGVFFIPWQVGLPDAHFTGSNLCEEDHPWHTFGGARRASELVQAFEPTDREPTLTMLWPELIERFRAIGHWDPDCWPGNGTAAVHPAGLGPRTGETR